LTTNIYVAIQLRKFFLKQTAGQLLVNGNNHTQPGPAIY